MSDKIISAIYIMRKTRHRRRSRRRRSRKMRGGMFGIGDALAKAGSMLGLTRPQGEDKEERPKSPPPTESPFEPVAKVESSDAMREAQPTGSVDESTKQMGGKKRRRRRKSKKRGGGCGCASPMTGGKRKRRRRRTHKKKRKSRRRRR